MIKKDILIVREFIGAFLAPLFAILLIPYLVGDFFLEYSLHSDAAWELTYMKLYFDGIFNSDYINPSMGAPLTATHDFWPWRQAVLGLYYYIISFFSSDVLDIYKTYYYSLFPVCALTMYLSLRFYFRSSILIAIGFSLLYAFIPFITVHHIHTSVQINNLGIPLLIGLLYFFYNKDYENVSFKKTILSIEILIAAIVIFFSASLSVYNNFYFFLLISFIIFKEIISDNRNPIKIYVFLSFFFVGLLTLIFNIYPHIIYKAGSYFTYDYMTRNFAHSTVYGISIVEFFVPVSDHLIEYFRFLSNVYNDNTEIRINFLSSYLGIIGMVSFLVGIFYTFKDTNDIFGKKIKFLGILLVLIFIFFYRGGIITAFYLYTDFMVLGSHYRIAPWVSCISLIIGASIFDQIRINYYSKLGWNNFKANMFLYSICRIIFIFTFLIIIALSLLDFRGMTAPFSIKPAYGNLDSVYLPQKEFYEELNREIDEGDMILKIPYRCFPETRHTYGSYYGDVWPYLLVNKNIRFSWMAFKEGTACAINTQISSMVNNIEEMVKYAKYYGYTGIIVNKKGFLDDGKSVISDFNNKLNLAPIIESKRNSYFGEYTYFDIDSIDYSLIKIEPIEGDSINKISSSGVVTREELNKILRIFPSPCVQEVGLILQDLKEKGIYKNNNCNPKEKQNNEFYYFSNDKINTYPGVKWSNGEMIVGKDYLGPIFSVAIHNKLDKGDYKIALISNNMNDSNLNYYDFNVTQWGRVFRKKDDFIFSLKDPAPAKKLKAIWIHVFKNEVTDKDLKLRALTIKKVPR